MPPGGIRLYLLELARVVSRGQGDGRVPEMLEAYAGGAVSNSREMPDHLVPSAHDFSSFDSSSGLYSRTTSAVSKSKARLIRCT